MNLVPNEYKFYTNSKVMSKLAKSAHNDNEYIGQTSSVAISTLFEFLKKISITHRSKILDLGCGNGAFSLKIAKEFNCFLTGIDLSKSLVDEANRTAKVHSLSKFCKFLVEDLSELESINNNYYDFLLCIGSLYWEVDISRSVKRWKEKLKKGSQSKIIIFSNFSEKNLEKKDLFQIENTSFILFKNFKLILEKNNLLIEKCIDTTEDYIKWLKRWCDGMKNNWQEIVDEMGLIRAKKMHGRFFTYLELAENVKVKRLILEIRNNN